MSNNPWFYFLLCVVIPVGIPTASLFFWLGMRYARYAIPGMFLPKEWRERL
jgi:hypothetical protein